ncbi:FxsA family protein [Algirhabdus cladophorae]|uniref:FxsA family protein n=1 Tax=Algirhabdus cladophorae TaxID=3377108 RepID=UPI003B846118
MWLLALFVGIPLIEIALFIQLGGFLGLWPTLGIVILTAMLGSWLVRNQGLLAIAQMKQSISSLQDPTEPIAHGAMILFSGALLLTPGFFTDAVGFSLLIPPVRHALYRYARTKIKVQGFGSAQSRRPRSYDDGIIDGEFSEVVDDPNQSNTPSKWTKH